MARFEKNYDSRRKPKNLKKSKARQGEKNQSFVLALEKWQEFLDEGFFQARVVEVHKRYAFVSPEPKDLQIATNEVFLATVAKKYLLSARKERNFLAVGDRVLCRKDSSGPSDVSQDIAACVIEKRDDRMNTITRLDPLNNKRQHHIAVNIGQLVIVASYMYPQVKWGLIDRYLALAESQDLPVVIILNKLDLLASQSAKLQDEICSYEKIYEELGYPLIKIAAGPNLSSKAKKSCQKELAAVFSDKLSLVTGHSGVGKSTIVNLLEPEIVQLVEDEEILRKGRHTTTFASLIKLAMGGFIVDSPGIKSFSLEERSAPELTYCFKEMRPFLNQCKFRECRHIDEPGCAILQAIEQNLIRVERYRSYVSMLTTNTGREGRLRDKLS